MHQIDCIELSSDEEEVSSESCNPYDTKKIFETFLAKLSSSSITSESVNFVKRLYNSSPSDFRHSKDFYTFIAAATDDCNPNRAVKIVTRVCQALCAESIPRGPSYCSLSPIKPLREVGVKQEETVKSLSSSPTRKGDDTNQACPESKSLSNHTTAQSESEHGQGDLKTAEGNPPTQGDGDDLQITAVLSPRAEEIKASTGTGKGLKSRLNGAKPCLTEEKAQKQEQKKQKRVELVRKKKIYKLQKLLEAYQKEIKDLSNAELSLAEMELEDSSYIRESKLKEKCYSIVKRLQELQDEDYFGDLERKRHIRVSSSNYMEINRAVEDVVNKHRRFPDVFDIRNVVRKVNLNYDLGLRPSEQHDITIDIFSEVGNRMQRRRKREFRKYTAHCYEGLEDEDPAEFDVELRRKLKENRRVAKANTNQVFKKFTQIQIDQSQGLSSSDDECMQTVLTHASRITPRFRDGNAEKVKKNKRGNAVRRKRETTDDKMEHKKRRQTFSTLRSMNDLKHKNGTESSATGEDSMGPVADVASGSDSITPVEAYSTEKVGTSSNPALANSGEASQDDSPNKETKRLPSSFVLPLEEVDMEKILGEQTDEMENGEKISMAPCTPNKSSLVQNASVQDSQVERSLELQPIAKFLGQKSNGVLEERTKLCKEQNSSDSLLIPKRSLLIQHEKGQTKSVKEKLKSLNHVVDQLRTVLKSKENSKNLKPADASDSPIFVAEGGTQASPSHPVSNICCSSTQSMGARSPIHSALSASAAVRGNSSEFADLAVSLCSSDSVPQTLHLPVEANPLSMAVSRSPDASLKGKENDIKRETKISQVDSVRDLNSGSIPVVSAVSSILAKAVSSSGTDANIINVSSTRPSVTVEPLLHFAVPTQAKYTREVPVVAPKTAESLVNAFQSRPSCPQQFTHYPPILIGPIKWQSGPPRSIITGDSSVSSTNARSVSLEGLIQSRSQRPKTHDNKSQPLNHVTSSAENLSSFSGNTDAKVSSGCPSATAERGIQSCHSKTSGEEKTSGTSPLVSRRRSGVSKGNINVIDLTDGDLRDSCEDDRTKTSVPGGQVGNEVERGKCGKMVAAPAKNSTSKEHCMTNVASIPQLGSIAKDSSLVALPSTTKSSTLVGASRQPDRSQVLYSNTQVTNLKGRVDFGTPSMDIGVVGHPTPPSILRPFAPAGLSQPEPSPLSIHLNTNVLQNMPPSFANFRDPNVLQRFRLLSKTSVEMVNAAPEAPMPVIASVSSLARVGPQIVKEPQRDAYPTPTTVRDISSSVARPTSDAPVSYRPLLTQQRCLASVSKQVSQTQGKPELRISAVSSLQGRAREGSVKHKDWIPLENVISALAESEKKSDGDKNPQIQAVWSQTKARGNLSAESSAASPPVAEGHISCRCMTSARQVKQSPRQLLSVDRSAAEVGQPVVNKEIHGRSTSSLSKSNTVQVPGPLAKPINNKVSEPKGALFGDKVTASQNGRPRTSCVRCGKAKASPGSRKRGAIPPVINIDSDED